MDRPGGADTDRYNPISGSLDLRQTRQDDLHAGLPYATGDVVLERYQIDQVVAEGPVGVVYSAVDLDMDVQIALKVVLAEYLPDQRALTKFQRVVEPSRDLSHENIVRIYDLDHDESRFIIAQQMIVGRTLAEVLAERLPQGIASPKDEVQALLTQIGEALAYAHPDRYHGALKPSNILILPAGLVITDFCLAGALDRDAYLAGHRHRKLPTRYLAPEYVAGRPVDYRADLYSLAVIAYELLTGIPFAGDRDRARHAIEELHPAARGALMEGLSRNPAHRPEHVDDLLDGVLAAVIEGTPTDQRRVAVKDSTNVLDLDDLEDVEDDLESEDDLLAGPSTSDDMTVRQRPSSPPPRRRAGGGFPVEPRTAEDIPPAFEPDPERISQPLGGRRADPEGMIEAADGMESIPDIELDGKRPNPDLGFDFSDSGPTKRPHKVKDAIEAMDFDASLEQALASAAAAPPLPPHQKKRRRPRPGDEPDPEAMRNRPVAAGGEIQAASPDLSGPVDLLDEPAVAVSDQALPPPRREGTAQVPIPEEPKRGLSWWVYLVIFGLVCGVVTTSLILVKRYQDKKVATEAAERRRRIAEIRAKQAMGPAPRRTSPNVGAQVIKVRPRRVAPRRIVWRGHCPSDARRIHNRRKHVDFCIDRYEYPNRRGVIPTTAVDESEALKKCAALGKRLCTRKEWMFACGGRKSHLYAYGKHYKEGRCVTADAKGRRRRPQPTGSRSKCRSGDGVYDLNGNMAEWVQGGQLMGGSAAKPGTQTSCESDAGSGGTAYNGFRCCVDSR